MSMRERYARDGFYSPVDVMPAREAQGLRAAYEAAEREVAGDAELAAMLRVSCYQMLPALHAVVCSPAVTDAVAEILGEDLLVLKANLFIKEPRSPHYVSWHQDLTYWGLEEHDEVTAWLALSPASVESGCMRFLPGSHREDIVPHRDTFQPDNLLTRGQELAVTVDESRAVDAELAPGQMSLHHGKLFHASHPNRSDDRRIGVAIRYIRPDMRMRGGGRNSATAISTSRRPRAGCWTRRPSSASGTTATCRSASCTRARIGRGPPGEPDDRPRRSLPLRGARGVRDAGARRHRGAARGAARAVRGVPVRRATPA